VSGDHKSIRDIQVESHDMSSPQFKDVATALALLTRFPIKADFDRASGASWAYPIAGTVLGTLAALITAVGGWLGVNPALAAGVYLLATILMSGAMHEDGLADTADGFWGGWETARRLEIMKDSAIGAYGVIALILSMITRWAAVWLLIEGGWWFFPLIVIETLSRSAMPVLMHVLPNARQSGLSQSQGRPDMATAGLAVASAAVLSLLLIGLVTVPLLIVGGLAATGMLYLAKTKIGGQTGDVLGATQQITAIALLMVLA
jgi:adenosylcobinamide-GDP ribazoletransferase